MNIKFILRKKTRTTFPSAATVEWDECRLWDDHDKRAHAATAKPPTTNAVSLGSEQTFAATDANDRYGEGFLMRVAA
jgi:hypothetical protein